VGSSSLSKASESGTSASIACIEYSWPGFLCPATYRMHFVSLCWAWCTLVHPWLIIVALVLPMLLSVLSSGWFLFSSLCTMCQGVELVIGASSADVVLWRLPPSSAICFCKGGVAPSRPCHFQSTTDWTYLISDPCYCQPHGWSLYFLLEISTSEPLPSFPMWHGAALYAATSFLFLLLWGVGCRSGILIYSFIFFPLELFWQHKLPCVSGLRFS